MVSKSPVLPIKEDLTRTPDFTKYVETSFLDPERARKLKINSATCQDRGRLGLSRTACRADHRRPLRNR